jgi:2-polyprenyl-3-methyl-5-hydroxy-6-metoxy-1,4-benzoquinol methylase
MDIDAKPRGVFERPSHTFQLDPRVLGWVLSDEAHPLNRIVKTIPEGAKVLDIGAGNGILAQLLKSAGRVVDIDAIEPDPVAQQAASPHYRSIFLGGVEEFIHSRQESAPTYDYIVLADVIEHLANPEPLLRSLKSLLSSEGRILLSTPNVAFGAVRLALLHGCFDYVDSGILERTHLRFFTLKTLTQLFAATGLYPVSQFHCLRNPLSSEISLNSFPLTPWILARLSRDELSFVYQFLFVLGFEPCAAPATHELGSVNRHLVRAHLASPARRVLARIRQYIRDLLEKS